MKFKSIRNILTVGAVCLSTLAGAAEDYPNKPVKVVVGFPAGQATDQLARMIARELTNALGQPFVVENKPGQTGSIALAALTTAPADGYTMGVVAPAPLVMNPHLYKSVPYDALKDFTFVVSPAELPLALVANPSAPFNTVDELIAYAKANPKKINYSSVGNGSMAHLTMEKFLNHNHIQMTHVPYQGSARAVPDLLSGVVQVGFDTVTVLRAHIGNGLKVLAVATEKETDLLPGVSTLNTAERGNIVASPWIGVVFRKGVPADVVNKVERAVTEAFNRPELQKAVQDNLGGIVYMRNAQQFSSIVASDYKMWKSIIPAVGAKVE